MPSHRHWLQWQGPPALPHTHTPHTHTHTHTHTITNINFNNNGWTWPKPLSPTRDFNNNGWSWPKPLSPTRDFNNNGWSWPKPLSPTRDFNNNGWSWPKPLSPTRTSTTTADPDLNHFHQHRLQQQWLILPQTTSTENLKLVSYTDCTQLQQQAVSKAQTAQLMYPQTLTSTYFTNLNMIWCSKRLIDLGLEVQIPSRVLDFHLCYVILSGCSVDPYTGWYSTYFVKTPPHLWNRFTLTNFGTVYHATPSHCHTLGAGGSIPLKGAAFSPLLCESFRLLGELSPPSGTQFILTPPHLSGADSLSQNFRTV